MILERGEKPEKTHDIIGLLKRTEGLGFKVTLSMEDAAFLNSIYKGRYPSEEGLLPHGEPSREDSERALIAAAAALRSAKNLL